MCVVVQDSKKDDDVKTIQHNLWWRSEQLKQRELFLSRQVELLAVTNIRGKCTVSLFNETESLDSYLNKDVSKIKDIQFYFRNKHFSHY